MRTRTRMSSLVAALAMFTACSSDSGTEPTPTPNPAIGVTATTATATVARGATATFPITVSRTGGYQGPVTLVAEGVPTDVVASFAPSNLPNGTTASTLSLTVGANAAAVASTITVRASGTGVTAQTTTVTLTVTAPTASITVSTGTMTAASVTQGASATVPLTLTRTNFTGDIALAVTGLPTGVTASFAPGSPLPNGVNATTLTLTAAANATVGTSNVTVTASGTGVTPQTAVFALTVAASTTPGFTVAAAPATLTVVAGQGATSTVTLARQGGFAGDVAVAVTGAPAGVTAVLAPPSLTGAATTSTLTIATTSATAPGSYTLTLTGSAAGQTARTTMVALTVTAVPGVTVTLAPAAVSVVAGASATSAITIARVGSFAGDVALTTEGAPAGVTLAYAPATILAASTTSQVTVNATAAAVPGAYNVTVRGTGAGGVTSSATLAVTVTAAPTITVSATNATAAPGATATSTVTLVRGGGYTGSVAFAVSGLPGGVTPTFTPTSTTGTSSQLSLAVGAAVTAGTYTGTVTASGTGVTNATGTFTLTVTGGGGGGNLVAFRFCDQATLPTFLAFRNGSTGAWTRVTAAANNTYNVTFSGTTGQVAYAAPNGNGGTVVTVLSNTTAEFPGIAAQECFQNPATKTVNGTVAGLGLTDFASIALGGGAASPFANGPFTITGAADGATDLVATRFGTTGPNRVILRRGINPPAGGSIGPVIDFGAAESFAPASAAYTVNNANGEMLQGFTLFQTANGGSGTFFNLAGATTSPLTMFGVPSDKTQAGDLHWALISASTGSGANTATRTVTQFNRELTARTLTLGAAAAMPTFSTLGATPYARIRAAGTVQAEYGDAMSVFYTQANGQRAWTLLASRGFLGAAGTFELDLPDLSGVAGFDNAWGLVAGASTSYTFTVSSGLQGLTAITEGASFKAASRSGTITP